MQLVGTKYNVPGSKIGHEGMGSTGAPHHHFITNASPHVSESTSACKFIFF